MWRRCAVHRTCLDTQPDRDAPIRERPFERSASRRSRWVYARGRSFRGVVDRDESFPTLMWMHGARPHANGAAIDCRAVGVETEPRGLVFESEVVLWKLLKLPILIRMVGASPHSH
jgi:hypothetical protein